MDFRAGFLKFIGVDFRINNLWTGGAVHKLFLRLNCVNFSIQKKVLLIKRNCFVNWVKKKGGKQAQFNRGFSRFIGK